MDVIKRILGLTNCHNDHKPVGYHVPTNGNILYLGHHQASQPNPAEVQRAIQSLYARRRTNKSVSRPLAFSFNEESMIGAEDDDPTNTIEFTMQRIVLSCVDANSQKILALFYHNPESRKEVYFSGLECHLFLCKSKDVARSFAERIAEALTISYRIRKRQDGIVFEQAPISSKTFARYVSCGNMEYNSEKRDSVCVSDSESTCNISEITTRSVSEPNCNSGVADNTSIKRSVEDKGILRKNEFHSHNNNKETDKPIKDDDFASVKNTKITETDNGEHSSSIDVDVDELTRLIDMNETNI